MIRETARYHGPVFCALIETLDGAVEIARADTILSGFYLVNRRVPIYIKYSTSRFGPWSFTFHRPHQQRQQHFADEYGECVMVFVCGQDGIVALSHSDFRTVLDNVFEEQESVRITRRRREMYHIKGRDGELDRKLSRSSLATVFRELDSNSPEGPVILDDAASNTDGGAYSSGFSVLTFIAEALRRN